jgi:hypothetical protein
MKPVRPIAIRFWEKVDKPGGADACWLWTGTPDVNGYGKLWWFDHTNKGKFAHRISWELHNGPIPDGLFVLHSCDNPPCVNPKHLFLGTQLDNMRDMVAKGRDRNPAAINRAKNQCKRGHDLTGQNLYIRKLGDREHRQCRECRRQANRRTKREMRRRKRLAA